MSTGAGPSPRDDDAPVPVQRRAPFSDNPTVGARGQRTHQRILEAALHVFGEVGYHRCGIATITDAAGCTRASFYQYFSSKEDVFRHLSGHVARELIASAEALGPVTAEADGRFALHAWAARHAAIHDEFEPVFRAFQAAHESDEVVATGSARIAARHVATVGSQVVGHTLPAGSVDVVIALLIDCLSRAPRVASVVRSARRGRGLEPARVTAALADLFHRTLFGLQSGVNDPRSTAKPLPRAADLSAALGRMAAAAARSAPNPTVAAIVDASARVLAARGYHATRVDDITDEAGLSHGAFYRYFENKDEVVRLVAGRAMREVAEAFEQLPPTGDGAALRSWLARYAAAHGAQATLLRVWMDAVEDDPELRDETAAALEWGRLRIVRMLGERPFGGDPEVDAILLVVLLDALAMSPADTDTVEAAALIVERGFLGLT